MNGVKYKIEVETSNEAIVFEYEDSKTEEILDDPWQLEQFHLVAVLRKLLGFSHKKLVEGVTTCSKFGHVTWVHLLT